MPYAAVWKHYTYTVVPRRGPGVRNVFTPSFELFAIAGTRREAARLGGVRATLVSGSNIRVVIKIVPVTTLPLLGITMNDVYRYYARALGIGSEYRSDRWVIRRPQSKQYWKNLRQDRGEWVSLGEATIFKAPSDLFVPNELFPNKGSWLWERVVNPDDVEP